MQRSPRRRLIWAALLLILSASLVLAGLGVRRALRTQVDSLAAGVPGELTVEQVTLRIAPLRLRLEGVYWEGRVQDHVVSLRAAEAIARVSRDALGPLLRERSSRAAVSALRSGELHDVSLAASSAPFSPDLQVSRVLVEAQGSAAPYHVRVHGVTGTLGVSAGAGGGSREGGPPSSGPSSLNAMASAMLESIDRVADAAPPLYLEIDNATPTVSGSAVGLTATARTGSDAATEISVKVTALPVRLFSSFLGGEVSTELSLVSTGPHSADLSGWVSSRDLSVDHPRIADEPLGPFDLRYDFDARLDTRSPVPPARLARAVPGTNPPAPLGAGAPGDADLRGSLTVIRGEARMGGVELSARPTLHGLNLSPGLLPFPGPARVDLRLNLPPTDLQTIVDALPPALLGPLGGAQLSGTVEWNIDLEAPLTRFSWTRWEETNKLRNFAIEYLPPQYDVRSLGGSFRHRIVDPVSGYTRTLMIPPPAGRAPPGGRVPFLGGTPPGENHDRRFRYVPLSGIDPVLLGAVVTAEDGEFYRHQGMNWTALNYAVERNLREGEIVIGGSTIPMQLAKNIFLDGRQVVVRKIQEIMLVTLANLSGRVTRDRVLEIYLNIIEFGPNIYGIADATAFYFGTTPGELSVPQAVWLASIIRSPRVLWRHSRDGVPPYWVARMDEMMHIMVERGRLRESSLRRFQGQAPEFRAGGT